ncbi:predicted protein, partial [Nematostella vectensis]
YSDVTGLSNYTECKSCPPGYYCPDGTSQEATITPLPCPIGTYNPEWNIGYKINCVRCTAGMFCPSAGQTNASHVCYEGYYCPNGTAAGDQFPCPPGTYGDRPGTPSPTKFPCPPGTYTVRSDLYDAAQCTVCPERYYCLGGEASPTAQCPPGYYCPNGTRVAEQFPCNNGTYNPEYGKASQSECLNCTQGHFCEKGSVQPEQCPIGEHDSLPLPRAQCDPGYVCYLGAYTPTPTDG